MVEISIIAPTMNEEHAPETVREIFRIFGKDVEVIVVDKSGPSYKKLFKKTGVKFIRQKSRGYEGAIMEGFAKASGTSVLASIDPDGTYSVSDLKRIVYAAKTQTYDFISGDRTGCSLEAMPRYIKFGNFMLALAFDILFLKRMKDVLNGSFAMKRYAFDAIKNISPYHAGTIFFEMELAKKGFRMKNIRISYKPRIGSESKIAKSKTRYGLKVLLGIGRGRAKESASILSEMFRKRFKK